jgi:DNA topoisomerase-1
LRGGGGGDIRTIGDHPEGGAISLKAGRFGPYLAWGKVNATLPRGTDMTGLTLDAAVEILKAKAAGAPSDGRLLGEHPDGGKIAARAGRFGPYVTWEKVNATLPKSVTLEDVTLEQAIRFIEDRIAQGGGKAPKKPAKKAPAKTAAAKKPAAKGAKAKPDIIDSDETPFEADGPAKKPAAKKAAAKK